MHSKWTAQVVLNKQKHFEVVSYNRKEKSVYLKPSLGGKSRHCFLKELMDPNNWKTGWL
ncbi:MAG: TIGR02450 family Trp-rich protein [Lentisphaeraceae bacterium]|nr:TIGR02450 family Trp-rich protein [Lentisphaeraceae bacterium]